MRLANTVTIMVAVTLAAWTGSAALAVVEDEAPPAEIRSEIRVETQVGPGGEPKVRMWIDGKEVDPGQAIQLREGDAQIRIAPAPAEAKRADEARAEGEKGEPREGGGALGVMISPLTDELARQAGVEAGVAVAGVIEGSPAAKAGLREGDVITHVAGKAVTAPEQLAEMVAAHKPGERVRIQFGRAGKRDEATVRLAARAEMGLEEGERAGRDRTRDELERPQRPRPDQGVEPGPREDRPETDKPEKKEEGSGFLGVMAAPLNDDIRDLAGTREGVLINSLTDDSPAAKAGLKPGDVIVRIDDTPVGSPEALVEVLRGREAGSRVHVTYYRMGKLQEARATLGRRPGAEKKPEGKEGTPLYGVPEDLFREMPDLREYLKGLQPQIEEWARRFQEERLAPQMPGGVEPGPRTERPPYDVGKDIGRLMERLEGIERRLDEMEKRLDRVER